MERGRSGWIKVGKDANPYLPETTWLVLLESCNVIYLMVDICLWDGWGISLVKGFMDPEVDIY